MTSFRRRGGWWVAGQGALIAAVVAGAWLRAPWPRWVMLVGALLVSSAAVLGVAAVGRLGSALTPYPEPRPDADLVDRGVYGLVRHPIYGAVALGALGFGLLVRSPVSTLLALGLLAYLAAKSVAEERRLTARHPGYAAYRERVSRRMIPWVW